MRKYILALVAIFLMVAFVANAEVEVKSDGSKVTTAVSVNFVGPAVSKVGGQANVDFSDMVFDSAEVADLDVESLTVTEDIDFDDIDIGGSVNWTNTEFSGSVNWTNATPLYFSGVNWDGGNYLCVDNATGKVSAKPSCR